MKKLLIAAMVMGNFTFSHAQSIDYADYQKSITDINWQSVITDLVLNTSQTNQLYALNDRYNNYDSWNRTYANDPGRWRYDRYGEMERILGREKYAKFKNKYYKGQNPTAVYNRNKNNDKRYKHMSNKVKARHPHKGKKHH